MTNGRREPIENSQSVQNKPNRISKDNLQVGDILLFTIPDDARTSDRFIQFMQRKRGISNEDSTCVHAAIVSEVTPVGTTIISHYVSGGYVEQPLKNSNCAYNQHPYDVVRIKDDKDNISRQIGNEARQPNFASEDNRPSYSILKVIVSFLRSNHVNQDNTRKYVPGYFNETKNREICSSFVARVVKKTQGAESNITSTFILPGHLRHALTNNPNFEINPTAPSRASITLPVTDEKRPEAAKAAGKKIDNADPDAIVKHRTRKRVHKDKSNEEENDTPRFRMR